MIAAGNDWRADQDEDDSMNTTAKKSAQHAQSGKKKATSRTIFFVSDGTGITAETLGKGLLSQFEGINFRQIRFPFVDSPEKAADCLAAHHARCANRKASARWSS